MTVTETIYAVRKTRKGAEAVVARDARWLTEGTDWVLDDASAKKDFAAWIYTRVSETTLEVRKADDGTFQVVRVTMPIF